MDEAVELLFAGAQTGAHALLEAAVFDFLAEGVAFVEGGEGGDDAVEEVKVRGEVVGRVPFDAADIRGCRHGRTFAGEVSAAVGLCGVVVVVVVVGEGNDVGVMEEDPEDFFRDADDFVAPDSVRSGVID